MKRYMVFAYSTYYPNGGINDLVGSYATLEEANKAYEEAVAGINDYAHIWDCQTESIIRQN